MDTNALTSLIAALLNLKNTTTSGFDRMGKVVLGMFLFIGLSSCNQATDSASETDPATPAPSSQGNTVRVLGAIVGDQQVRLEAALAPFEQETGIDVIYEGTDAFTTLLPVRVDSGEPPDVAMFPQPGLMKSLAEEGALVALDEVMSRDELLKYYPESWVDLSTVNEQVYGVWYRSAVKSLVWYVPEEFKKRGYKIPNTWDEMLDLSDQIVAEDNHPWCLAVESGNASGWVGTDWIEEILLRTAGPDFYEQWVKHEVPFNAPEVQEAFEYFGNIVRSPGYVWGGTTAVLSIPFGDSPVGLFTPSASKADATDESAAPQCFMHRQANFVTGFFPEGVTSGEDVDFFPTPNINPEYGNALLVGGDIFSMLNDTPEARKLMAYLATPTPHEIWAKEGDFLSANKQVNLDVYPDAISRKQAELLTSADIVQFDGSDAMPGAVGTGTFWSGMMDFIAGASAAEVTERIEYYWPESVSEESSEE
ncbi:MAG: ABC transporter substrate-binding protein [Cyanobacteria bacterium P01_F01_bin.53]